jgi:hypothetical protein
MRWKNVGPLIRGQFHGELGSRFSNNDFQLGFSTGTSSGSVKVICGLSGMCVFS